MLKYDQTVTNTKEINNKKGEYKRNGYTIMINNNMKINRYILKEK